MNYNLFLNKKAVLVIAVRDHLPDGTYAPFRADEGMEPFQTYLYPHKVEQTSVSSLFFLTATDDRRRTSKMNVSLRNRKGQFVSYRTATEEYGISEQVGIDIANLPNI